VNTSCQLCQKRRARRHCPGVEGDICPQCCATERENTIDCPLDCVYLVEARTHEKPNQLPPAELPNADIQITEGFLEGNQELLTYVSVGLLEAVRKQNPVDADVREALESLIRTYRTLQSGLIYESKPQNPYAASIQESVQANVEKLRAALAKETGMHTVRDSEILGVLVFLQRMELQMNNGRKRGRAFLSFLRASIPLGPAESEAAPALSL